MSEQLDILAFGAHPDDVELMCGGTMIKLARLGYAVGVISLTAGEMGTRGTPEIRSKEFAASAQIMGLVMHKSLDIADGLVATTPENKIKVIRQLRQYTPKIVFAPYWKTRHPDHGNCSHLLRESLFLSGLKKIDTGQPAFRPARLVYFMEHFEFTPSFIVDTSETFETRIQAIQAYQSQVFGSHLVGKEEDATYISSQQYFNSIAYRAHYWGHKIGVTYGEPFLVREPLKVIDPFDFLSR